MGRPVQGCSNELLFGCHLRGTSIRVSCLSALRRFGGRADPCLLIHLTHPPPSLVHRPLIGSFASITWSWRACFVILSIFAAVCLALCIFACPETYAPVILSRVARDVREELQDVRIVSRLEFKEMASRGTPKMERLRREAVRVFRTPFIMLFTESIVSSLTAFMSLVYGLSRLPLSPLAESPS